LVAAFGSGLIQQADVRFGFEFALVAAIWVIVIVIVIGLGMVCLALALYLYRRSTQNQDVDVYLPQEGSLFNFLDFQAVLPSPIHSGSG
jgi:hypothetical protein